jgi:hypothetical protein
MHAVGGKKNALGVPNQKPAGKISLSPGYSLRRTGFILNASKQLFLVLSHGSFEIDCELSLNVLLTSGKTLRYQQIHLYDNT